MIEEPPCAADVKGSSAKCVDLEMFAGHSAFSVTTDVLKPWGVFPGDSVVVDTKATPQREQLVVVALPHFAEPILRRWYPNIRGKVGLAMPGGEGNFRLPAESVRVLGVVVGLIRKF